jgi:hypothetical protein
MNDYEVTLTSEEFELLRELLEEELEETRIEEYRTRTPCNWEIVFQKKDLIVGLLDKFQQPVG